MQFAFDDFRLDIDRAELSGPEGPVHIEKYPFDLLVLLARNHDRVVSKDEIIEVVWGGRIVSDAAISTAVKQARRAIGDSGSEQRIIRTVHGRGFRFAIEVVAGAPAQPVAPSQQDGAAPGEPAGRARPSVAVLRFQYFGAPGPALPLADAVPAELIASLSRLHWARVIARASSFQFTPGDIDPTDVGRRLGARYLISGSLEAGSGELTFSVELVEAASAALIWSDRFTSALAEVQMLRMRLVSGIISALEVELPRFEADAARRLSDSEFDAWSHYHIGLRHLYRYKAADNLVAAEHFGKAIALNPDFARAHAGLSLVHWQTAFMQYGHHRAEPLALALGAANAAIEIDPNEPLAIYCMGRARWLQGDLDSGLAWLDRALVINPNFAQCHYIRGMSHMLAGNQAEALGATATAIELSPLDPLGYGMHGVRALSYLAEGRTDEALAAAERSAQSPGAHFFIEMIASVANDIAGNRARAEAYAARARAMRPDATREMFFQAFPFVEPGLRRLLSETLARLGF